MSHEPGIYTAAEVSEAEYHADESLGSSSLKRLLISPLTYWVHSPHNPNRPDDDETDATEYGTALHVRLLQGREAFEEQYAPAIKPEEFPGCLKSGDELAARCAELGLAKNGTLAERSARIKAKDPDAVLWTDIVDRYVAEIGDRTQIPREWIRNIEFAAAAIAADRNGVDKLLDGGRAEVSLFWRHVTEDGQEVPLKARLDYWHRPAADVVDLKSFANQKGRDLERAVAMAVAQERYDIQAYSYLSGIRQLTGRPHSWTWLFVNSGPAPNVLAREFAEQVDGETQVIWQKARRDFEFAVGLWARCERTIGLDRPWVTPATRQAFVDSDFPIYALD